MIRKKICIITGTRAEYGLLKPLIQKIKNDEDFLLQLVVTGMHLSTEFGLTFNEIQKDGFQIDEKIEILLSSDSAVAVSKAMGLAQISFSEMFNRTLPGMVIILGDRFEMLAIAIAARIANIPIIHLHGGELTLGAYDDAFRHSITKLSTLHFTSTEKYKNRVIQMGEPPQQVFNVGALGVESIHNLTLLTKTELENKLKFKFLRKNILVTYHPETDRNHSVEKQFNEILNALKYFDDARIVFTKANADNGGRTINKMIDEHVKKNSHAVCFTSLGQLNYLSCLQYADVVLGNSSSGIIEVPSFDIPTINVGDRQKGRVRASQTIDVTLNDGEIRSALNEAFLSKSKNEIVTNLNPYYQENTAQKIVGILKKTNLDDLSQKSFYDIGHEDQ